MATNNATLKVANKGIKFAGHTMGMGKPAADASEAELAKYDIHACIKLFKEIGYDGIEVRVAKDGQIDSETITNEEAEALYQEAKAAGMEFACLTSYYQNFAHLEERDEVIAKLKRVVEIASILHCRMVRVYGGTEARNVYWKEDGHKDANGNPAPLPHPKNDMPWFTDCWGRTVDGIRQVAQYAALFGVNICIETHIGSLTMSIRDTLRMAEDTGMQNVGILLDYAWVELAGVEIGEEAFKAAAGRIFHIHVKDWSLESRLPLKKKSCLMGKGTVQWERALKAIKESGFNGYISDEYEKYWYPAELPDAEIGMKHNLNFMKEKLGLN